MIWWQEGFCVFDQSTKASEGRGSPGRGRSSPHQHPRNFKCNNTPFQFSCISLWLSYQILKCSSNSSKYLCWLAVPSYAFLWPSWDRQDHHRACYCTPTVWVMFQSSFLLLWCFRACLLLFCFHWIKFLGILSNVFLEVSKIEEIKGNKSLGKRNCGTCNIITSHAQSRLE